METAEAAVSVVGQQQQLAGGLQNDINPVYTSSVMLKAALGAAVCAVTQAEVNYSQTHFHFSHL